MEVHTDKSIWRYFQFNIGPRRFGVTTLDRYIFLEILAPFSTWLAFLTALFMSVALKDIVGELLGKGIAYTRLLAYLGYLIAEKLTMTIPMACLLSGIMAAGRLSGDSEVTAMRGAGISFPRMYAVFIVFGVLSMLIVGFMNLYIGPLNAKARADFEDELKSYHSLALVKPGRFLGRSAVMDGVSKKGQDIYAEKKQGPILQNVQIREWFNKLDQNNSETVRILSHIIPIGDGFITQIVHAGTGELMDRRGEDGKISRMLRLKKGFIIELDEKQSRFEVTDFRDGYMDYIIPPPAKSPGRISVKPDNYTIAELFDFLEKLEKGGNTIDLCALSPDCAAQGGNQKVGASGKTIEEGGRLYRLPALSEMKAEVLKLQLWVGVNAGKVDKPGGVSSREFQQRVLMWKQMETLVKDADKTQRRFEVEIQKRFATPVACLLFFFVSFPLGLVVKRSGKGMGFALAGFVFVVYYFFQLWGLSQAYRGAWSPVVGAWIPDVVIAMIGVHIMSTRTDGFSPFGFILRPIRRLRGKLFELLPSGMQSGIIKVGEGIGRVRELAGDGIAGVTELVKKRFRRDKN